MRAQSLFKEQLLEYVEWREEPFDVEFLRTSCNDRFVDDASFQNALWMLEEEGKIASAGVMAGVAGYKAVKYPITLESMPSSRRTRFDKTIKPPTQSRRLERSGWR